MNVLRVLTAIVAITVIALPCVSSAGTWTESGDAGGLLPTAQVPTGTSPLTEINGTLAFFRDPVTFEPILEQCDFEDVYKIYINDPATFSADSYPSAPSPFLDTIMYLFDANGYGVYMNDDHPTGDPDPNNGDPYWDNPWHIDASTPNPNAIYPPFDAVYNLPSYDSELSWLPPGDDDAPTTAGIYYLALSLARNLPLSGPATDALGDPLPPGDYGDLKEQLWQRMGNSVNPLVPGDTIQSKWNSVREPDGDSYDQPLGAWKAPTWVENQDDWPPGNLSYSSYKISLTGASFAADAPANPGPGDANNDGYVDDTDASILGSHWMMSSGATWADGDFNGDYMVNDKDAAILAAYWSPPAEGASVPEPSMLVLLAIGGLFLVWRKRKAMGL